MNNTNYSVLMSIYHKENPSFFADSIESMLNQTIKPDEIVIVKDGPLTPELDKVIDKYVQQQPKLFTIVPLEKNLGLGLALNEGIKKSRNELIARMDTDDISLENRCELQMNEFDKNPDLCIVGTWTNEFFDEPSNIVMKFLTSVTIVMAIPTMISSFFGMNVDIPLTGPFSFWVIVAIAFALCIVTVFTLYKKKLF